jgi:superfamily II DNA or RNA helicase
MVHSLSQHKEERDMEFRRRFGLVLYDEGHHMSAPVFVKSADLFFGRRYSLTATPNRTDGLEMIYQFHLGRVIHTNLSQDLIPDTYFHILQWEPTVEEQHQVLDVTGEVNVNKVRTFLGSLDWRNNAIVRDIKRDMKAGRQLLVLSHSVEHVNELGRHFRTRGAGIITGQTMQEDRMAILRECNPVFGTFQLAREGLNKPTLDTLYVVTPFSNANDMQQAWGRIQRHHVGKQKPLVRIYEDHAFPCCIRSCRGLRKNLRKINYPIFKVTTEFRNGT